MSTTVAPVAAERIEVLDAVRGVAVLGILFVNIESLSGYTFIPPAERPSLALSGLDDLTAWLVEVFVEGKFYGLFSLLFGVGFAVFVHRAARGADAIRLFRRRLVGLLLIGLVHSLLIWFGDILVTYAVLGFALVPFLRKEDRALVRWAVGLFILPILLYAAVAIAAAAMGAPPAEGGGAVPPIFAAAPDKFARGSYVQVVEGNAILTLGNVARRIMLMFFPRVFGMFLLGLVIGRRNLLADVEAHRPLLRRVTVWGFAAGLPTAILGAAAGALPAMPIPLLLFVEGTAKSIAIPALALAYAAGLCLLFHRARGLMRAVAPAGRMALTNYLLHSVAGVVIFYGIGFGYFGRVSLAIAIAGAIAFFGVQMILSRWWLSRAAFGPAEWIWRMFTYGQWFPLISTRRSSG